MGLIFSIVGICKKNASGKAMAIIGLVLTLLGIAGTVGFYGLVAKTIASDPSLSQEWEDIWDSVDTSAKDADLNYGDLYIDGDFINTDNNYVTGVLHIDGYRVDF